MPELSDVEGFRRYFARHAKGKRIGGVRVPDEDLLRNTSPSGIGRALKGKRFDSPRRHGKWLIAPAGEATVLLHFGMTGGLDWTSKTDDPPGPHHRVIFELDGGEMRFRDQRKFGGVWLVRAGEEIEDVTGPLGPDARSLSREQFDELVAGRRGGIKGALMDQELLAGLGNELSDEILWRARIDPRTDTESLGRRERTSLYKAMDNVLDRSIERGHIPRERGWLESVRDQRGADCPRCGTTLRRDKVAGRTAIWCPRCQGG